MKYFYVIIALFIIVAVIYGLISKKPVVTKTEVQKNPYQDLRNMIFSITPEQLNMNIKDKNQPLCTIMELNVSGETATLVSVVDGSTSLYFSTGGGIIGGGTHENVRKASLMFLEESRKYINSMKRDIEHHLPKVGHTCFYVLTIDEVYKYDDKEDEISKENHPFYKLYGYGQNVITELRRIEERKGK